MMNLALISGGNWNEGANAGVWARAWFYRRTNTIVSVGFRASAYGQ